MIGLAAASSCDGSDDADWSGGDPESGDDDKGSSLDAGASGTRRDASGSFKPDGGLVDEEEQPLSFETPKAGKTSVYVPDP
ncbi:MAG TPA: hypothetical protein VFX59_21500, partial [Polyangiales bacterium]|nr:hypothetical protein [Polyangiales bacterium]